MRPFDCEIEYIPACLFQRPADAPPPSASLQDLAALLAWAGWPSPVVVDDQGRVIAGADRVDAAMLLGEQCSVPVARLSTLNPRHAAVFKAADARLGAMIQGGAEILRLDDDAQAGGPAKAQAARAP